MRHQLPVYSPLTAGAVLAGLKGLVSDRALARVEELVRREYAPAALRLTDSGTTALAAAIRLAAAGGPPVVAMPAWACYDLATAADIADARVILYDVDPETLGPSWPSLEAILANGPSSVVVAHFYGIPVDMDRVTAAAAVHGVTVIEDAAQGVGARWRGRPLGSHAPFAVLSFGRGKGRTGGRGGALLVNDQRFFAAAQALALPRGGGALVEVILLAAQWLFGRASLYGLLTSIPALGLGQTVYRPPHPARRMSGVAAEVLAATWELEPGETAARRANASRLGAPGFVSVAEGAEPGWLRVPVVRESPRAVPRLGVMPGYPRALADLPGFESRIVNRAGDFAGARLLAERLVTLPCHSRLRERDLEELAATTR